MDPLTEQEKESYANASMCFICEKPFGNVKNAINVRDHGHFTGKYRGAAHSASSLQDKIPTSIPVVFHNGSMYDFHLIIEQLVHDIVNCKHCEQHLCIYLYSDSDP